MAQVVPAEIKTAPDNERTVRPKERCESNRAVFLGLYLVRVERPNERKEHRDVNGGSGNAKNNRPEQLLSGGPLEPALVPDQRAQKMGNDDAKAGAHQVEPGAEGGSFRMQ